MMKIVIRLILVLIALASVVHASVSIITGQIKDAQGNPVNGTLVMRLPIPAQDPTTQSAIAPVPVTFSLINGQVTGGAPLYDLATIQPGKLWYSARAYDTTGALVFYGNYYVTGATFNIGAATPTVVTTSNISFTTIPQGGASFGTVVPAGNTIQSTINAVAAAGTGAPIAIPQGYTGSQNFTNTSFLPILNFTPSANNGYYDKNGVQPVDIFGVRHDGLAAQCTATAGSTTVTCSPPVPFSQSVDAGKIAIFYGAGPSSQTHGGIIVGSVTASGGSGGTPGVQPLKTTNGGCLYPERGWVTVNNSGSITPGSVVTVWIEGFGCTSLPTTAQVGTVTGTVTLSGVNWTNVDLPTSIVSVQNGTTITLADAPSVSGPFQLIYGTDDVLGLEAACNGHHNGQNGGHFTHSGTSLLSRGPVCQGNDTWIEGAGWAPLGTTSAGSNLVYAGRNVSGTDGIWNSQSGFGAKLTDFGLKGNSWALPRGLRIMKSLPGDSGTGNSAAGEYDRLWIGLMFGESTGNVGGQPQLSKGIYADVATGNGDFNSFRDIHIEAVVEGIDGNNDQATNWAFMGNLQIEASMRGICNFNAMRVADYYTELNQADIQLGSCTVGGSGAPKELTIDSYGGESSAQGIVPGNASMGIASNSPNLFIRSGGAVQPSNYLDPSGVTIDLTGPINTGSITLGESPLRLFIIQGTAKVNLPAYGNNGFGAAVLLNGIATTQLVPSAPGTNVSNNSSSTPFTLNGDTLRLTYNDTLPGVIPWQQNDFEGVVRDFGSTSIFSPRPPGQTDRPENPVDAGTVSVIGTPGSTTYHYYYTCSDQNGNETAPAPTTFGGSTPVLVTVTNGPATLTTSNYIQFTHFWTMRGCAYYNYYGDEGVGGVVGYLTTLTSNQLAANNLQFNDQGQYTKNTSRVPPTKTNSGFVYAEGGYKLGSVQAGTVHYLKLTDLAGVPSSGYVGPTDAAGVADVVTIGKLGYTNVGANNQTGVNTDWIAAASIPIATSTAIDCKVGLAAAAGNVACALYDSDGASGSPGTVLCQNGTGVAAVANSLNTIPISGCPTLTTGHTYYTVVGFSSATTGIDYDSVGSSYFAPSVSCCTTFTSQSFSTAVGVSYTIYLEVNDGVTFNWGPTYNAGNLIPSTFIPWATPGTIGSTTRSTGAFTRLNISDKGTCTMAAGTCSAQSLATTYAAAPTCFATYTGTGTLAGTIKITSTTTTVTPASTTGTDTAQVNWACLGN